MLAATLLGISLLGWAFVAFGMGVITLGYFVGWYIHGAEEPIEVPAPELKPPADVNDWSEADGAEFDFKLWKRPSASTKGAAEVATPDAITHGGNP